MAETFTQRLKRYTNNSPIEVLGWLTMMLQNYHIVELRCAREQRLYHCVYLLAHSIIHTVSETMFGKTGLSGTAFFLEHFADGTSEDRQFSRIASEVHEIRNIIAHRGYSKTQHEVQYFIDDIPEGWRREEDSSLTINPAIYSIQIEDVFRRGKIYQAFSAQDPLDLLRLKYRFIGQWLDLDKSDTIAKAIKALDKLDSTADLELPDEALRKQIYERYVL